MNEDTRIQGVTYRGYKRETDKYMGEHLQKKQGRTYKGDGRELARDRGEHCQGIQERIYRVYRIVVSKTGFNKYRIPVSILHCNSTVLYCPVLYSINNNEILNGNGT